MNSNIEFAHDISLTGNVTLTFKSGSDTSATMTVNGTINGNNFAGSLTVNGEGTLKVTASSGSALNNLSAYTQTGATVDLSGQNYCIYATTIKISGGTLSATGGNDGLFGGNVNITGGVVTAKASGTNGYDISGGSEVNISGGQVTANGNGIKSDGSISIGYTSETDSITAASFTGTVTVKDNCWFTDGENMYSGTLTDDQKKAIAGKKLTTKICNVKVDGSNVTADKTGSILYGQTVTLTYTGSAKAGYEIFFTVNNTEIDGESFMVTEDATVNVKVTATSYSIEYNLDGGTNAASNPSEFTVETETFSLSDPTKEGYPFEGWTGSNGTTASKTVTITKGSRKNRTYKANWTANTYTVKFDANNGTGTMSAQSYTYDTAQAITTNTFTREGYTFAGWTTTADGTGTVYTDGQEVKNLAAEGEITLYAKWTPPTYTITYDLDSGTNAKDNPATYTPDEEITLEDPTKTGFTFLGLVGTGITEATKSPVIAQGSMGNRQYTALWRRTGGFAPAGDTPEFTYHSLVLSGKIGVMFYMYIPKTLTAEDCYMDFTVSGDVAGKDVSYSRTYTAGDYTLYGYECPITSVQMADKITAKFSYGTSTIKQEYRAKTYIDGVIADTNESDNSRNLCKAIKNYDSYVQPILADSNNWVIGVDHAKMDSADAYTADDFTNTATNTADYAAKYDIPTDSGIDSVSCSLVLDSDTAIKIYLTPKTTYTDEVVAAWGGYSNTLTQNSAGQYVVEISDIPAHELSKTYTVTITTGSVNFDIEVSALSYVQGVIKSDASSTAMKEAVTAIYRYYSATMTYRGNN